MKPLGIATRQGYPQNPPNPYPDPPKPVPVAVGEGIAGKGTGSPGKHQGYPCQSLTGNGPTNLKETKTNFVRKPWAVRTALNYKVVSKLSERVWGEIHEASTSAISSVDVDAADDDSEIEDPEDLVQLSSDDEAT